MTLTAANLPAHTHVVNAAVDAAELMEPEGAALATTQSLKMYSNAPAALTMHASAISESVVPPRLSLREAGVDDREFLFRVFASTRDEELAVAGWTAEEVELFLRMQFEAQDRFYREHYEGTTFSVIECDDMPAGRLYLARWPDEIRIMDIALLPDHRGSGIGTALLRDVIEEAERDGKRVSIHVERNNPARRLYARLGFREVEDRGVYLFLVREPAAAAGA